MTEPAGRAADGGAAVGGVGDGAAADGDDVSFDVVSPTSADAQRAMNAYFEELDERFRAGFDRSDGGVDNDAAAMSPPGGAFVVARRSGMVIGCGGVLHLDLDTGNQTADTRTARIQTAEIKRMWVSGDARGLGLGKRLLAALESVADELGCERVVLDTNAALTEAIAMYGRCGYEPIERYNDNPYADHWFAKSLA